jgi:hypothetical protein
MKTYLTILCALFIHVTVNAAGGFFDSFAYTKVNNGNNTFYDLAATTGNPDFLGSNLGTIIQGQTLRLGGQIKTWKNNGTNITGVAIFYRYYIGAPSGSHTQINYAFQIDNVNGTLGDQQWGTDVNGSNPTELSVNILPGNIPVGTYTLDIFVRITTNGNDAPLQIFDNRSGANYQATFTVEAPLSASVIHFSAIEKASETHLSASINYENPLLEVSFQKMQDGNAKSAWSNIATFSGSEISSSLNYIDRELNSGEHYYRLAVTDRDGLTYYSSIQKVNIRGKSNFSIYPNPFTNELYIKGLDEIIESKIVISDLLGRHHFESVNLQELYNLDVSGINKGIYILKIFDNSGKALHQQILMK